jgi:hypothetical protein
MMGKKHPRKIEQASNLVCPKKKGKKERKKKRKKDLHRKTKKRKKPPHTHSNLGKFFVDEIQCEVYSLFLVFLGRQGGR